MTTNHRALEEIDIELIERIKLSPCLYDTRNPDFRLVYKKQYQWQNVAKSLSMTPDDARKRWTVLRDRYARELRRINQLNPKNECGENDFFRRMDFLRCFVKKRRVRKKIGTLQLESKLPMPVAKLEYTVHPFEMLAIQPPTNMQRLEECQEVVYDTQMEESHESQRYQEYVDDSYETEIMENQDTSCNSSFSNRIHNDSTSEVKPLLPSGSIIKTSSSDTDEKKPPVLADFGSETEELFSKVIASYLKTLSRRYKIKAKVEMMQILEKYIDIEENERRSDVRRPSAV